MASAEDVRVLLERLCGMERMLMEQQGSSRSSHGCTSGIAAAATAVSNDCTARPASGRVSCRWHEASGQTSDVRLARDELQIV